MTYIIGIDISKNDFHVCFSENEDVIIFSNTAKGIEKFLRYLAKTKRPPELGVIGMESTGSYHLQLALRCREAQYEVRLLNPLVVNKYNKTHLRRVKTDVKDARLIRFCLVQGLGAPFRETTDSFALKSILRERNRLVQIRQQTKILSEEMSTREGYLKQSLHSSYPAFTKFLSHKITSLNKILSSYQPVLQRLLRSIPGIGSQTAITLIAEVGHIGYFKTPQQLTAFVGLDPRVHQSGTSIHGKGYITKRGNKFVRTRLFNAATVAVLHPNLFQNFFIKKRSEGKPYRVALCAVMRKMVHVIHAVWSRGTPFIQYKE